jgi:hypothetical protein
MVKNLNQEEYMVYEKHEVANWILRIFQHCWKAEEKPRKLLGLKLK